MDFESITIACTQCSLSKLTEGPLISNRPVLMHGGCHNVLKFIKLTICDVHSPLLQINLFWLIQDRLWEYCHSMCSMLTYWTCWRPPDEPVDERRYSAEYILHHHIYSDTQQFTYYAQMEFMPTSDVRKMERDVDQQASDNTVRRGTWTLCYAWKLHVMPDMGKLVKSGST